MIYVSLVLALLLCLSLYKNVRLGITILRMEDTIEECLDTIDEKYQKMSEILERPLFYDSPEVKAVVRDIDSVRDSIHSVAVALASNITELKEENE